MQPDAKYPLMRLTAPEVIKLRRFTDICKANKNEHKVTDRKYTAGATEK